MIELANTNYPSSPHFKDRSGQIVNGIEILEFLGQDKNCNSVYLCKCPFCGNIFDSRWNSLQQGMVSSCGCRHAHGLRKDDEYSKMIGQTINRLKIIGYRRIEKNGKSRGYFDCECECGNFVTVRTDVLVSGQTKSCGCLQKDYASEFMKNADHSTFKKSSRVYVRREEFDNLELMSHVGETHNRLKIIGCVRKESGGRLRNFYHCECECGNELDVRCDAVLKGTTTSCGCAQRDSAKDICIKRNTTHGLAGSGLYTIWNGMKARCNYEKSNRYYRYGARGIKICDEWIDPENGFINFYNWAIANGYEEGLTIDRIDVNGNYEPLNCKWATEEEQAWNKSNNVYITYEQRFDDIGKPPIRYTYPLTVWSRITGIPRCTLHLRLFKNRENWSVNDALTTPASRSNRNNYREPPMVLNLGEYIHKNQIDKYEVSIHD